MAVSGAGVAGFKVAESTAVFVQVSISSLFVLSNPFVLLCFIFLDSNDRVYGI